MLFRDLSLGSAPIFAALVAAAPPQGYSYPSSSYSSHCYTQYANSKGLCSTSWTTSYVPCTMTYTSTVTTISTLPVSTSTITNTATATVTAPTSFSTATSTVTATTTTTATTVATETTTTTTTTSVSSTSTVPTPAGFVAVQTSLPGSTYSGPAGPVKRELTKDLALVSDIEIEARGPKDNKSAWSPTSMPQYPKGVTCQQYAPAKCSIKVTTSTSTITKPAPTVTTTTTTTVTTTTIPSATTTTTTTTTSTSITTSTSTSTTTTTNTVTSVTSSTTVYAACATNNIADAYLGSGISGLNQGYLIDGAIVASAYDCCVAALNDPNGGAVFFAYAPGGGTNCLIGYDSSESTSTCIQPDDTVTPRTGDSVLVIGNGYCGEVVPTN